MQNSDITGYAMSSTADDLKHTTLQHWSSTKGKLHNLNMSNDQEKKNYEDLDGKKQLYGFCLSCTKGDIDQNRSFVYVVYCWGNTTATVGSFQSAAEFCDKIDKHNLNTNKAKCLKWLCLFSIQTQLVQLIGMNENIQYCQSVNII